MINELNYKLEGIKCPTLRENQEFEINDPYIKSIKIDVENNLLNVKLHQNINYENVTNEIELFIEKLFINLLIAQNTEFTKPNCILLTPIQDKINLNMKLEMVVSANVKTSGNRFYSSIIPDTRINHNKVIYDRINSTLANNNYVVQFLSLYQLLLELASKNKPYPAQHYVTRYIKNNNHKYQLKISKVKIKNKKKPEPVDELTCLRNKIAHAQMTNNHKEYIEIGNEININIIKTMIKILNDLI